MRSSQRLHSPWMKSATINQTRRATLVCRVRDLTTELAKSMRRQSLGIGATLATGQGAGRHPGGPATPPTRGEQLETSRPGHAPGP